MNQVYNAIFSDIIHNEFDFDGHLTEKALMVKIQCQPGACKKALMHCATFILSSIPVTDTAYAEPDQAGAARYCKLRAVLECSFLEQYYYSLPRTYPVVLREICRQYADKQDKNFINYWKLSRDFHAKLFPVMGMISPSIHCWNHGPSSYLLWRS